MKMLRVAFLAPEFLPALGGVGTYSVELVKNLSKNKDIEVHVITPSRGKDYDKAKVMEHFGNRVNIHNISAANDSFLYNIGFQLAVLRNFNKLNEKYNFDLVHSANLVHMPDIFLKFGKLNIPSVTTVHTTLKSQSHAGGSIRLEGAGKKSMVERMTALTYPYISMMEKKYLRETDNLITVSSWVKGFIRDDKGSKNIEVIPNGVDTERFRPSTGSKEVLDFEGINNGGRPIVLYCGRLMALKGLKTLIGGMKKVLDEHDAYFVFAGPGDSRPWEEMIKAQGISREDYSFLGHISHEKIPLLYQKSDIFVLPSFTESCPITIIEAMACGLPVIASDVGGVSEIIAQGKDGMLIEPGNPDQLADSILLLLKDDWLRNNLAKEARAKAEERFSSEKMAESTIAYYNKVLEMNKNSMGKRR